MTEGLRTKPFNIDLDDLVALAGQVDQSRMRMLRWGAAGIVALVAVTVMLEVSTAGRFVDWTLIVVGLVSTLGIVIVSSVRFRGWLWLRFAQRRPLHGPQVYELLPGGLLIVAEKGRTEISWTSLYDVACDNGRLFVFLAERLAYVIPRRAFDSDEQFEAFAGVVRAEWKKRHRL